MVVETDLYFEEDGRKVRIFSELLIGKISRGIHVASIENYEAPHESESLSDERRKDILEGC